jgi:ornithine cyclodeaminase/alanine dehydrogenase
MDIIYLSRADVESLGVGMRQVLDAVDNGFRLKGLGMTEMPPKIGIHPGPDAFIHAMPAYVKEVESAGLKWVSGFPSNVAKKLPYITGLLILNDPETGIPIAVMDCAWITAMRTGASVGISARYLGSPTYRVAGLVGCGVQARTSLMAMVETLPNLSEIVCNDLFPAATERFISDMSKSFPKLKFTASQTAAGAVRDADIVVTAIPIVSKPNPPLDADLLKPGALAVSLDYDSAWTGAAMKQCKFVCDDTGQLLYTKAHGVYFSNIPDAIHADLGDLAAGKKKGRENPSERIFSMNMGIAIDDIVTAKVLLELARQKNIGTVLPL